MRDLRLFPNATLADLYDPLAMPPALDRAVDKCYRPADFPSDRARVEYLFQLYEQLTAPLAPSANPKRPRKPKSFYAQPPPAPSGASPTPDSEPAFAVFHNIMGKEDPVPYRTSTTDVNPKGD